MAMGTEEQDLGELVARLSALIEDAAIVESGPRVEKKQAYIVVRHIKFGPSKKGGSAKKASKTVEPTNPSTENPDSNSFSPLEDDEVEDQSDLETGDESLTEENRYKRGNVSISEEVNSPVTENRYRRPDKPPVIENRYNRVNNSMPRENKYNRESNSPVTENRYNRGNNSMPTENRYNRINSSPVTENRYTRVNNLMPNENRYNRENNSPVVEIRYKRDHQYNPNAEGGRERLEAVPQFRSNNSRFPANDTIANNVGENRYRNGNNSDPTRHPRPEGDRFGPPYSDGRRQSG